MNQLSPMLMPYVDRDVPHAVLEVNQKCNIVCRACYKHKRNETKSIEQLREEVDLLASMRNLNAMTLAGGEPVLHPELPEIIRYISSKGIMVQMLSNGQALSDELLEEYREAGLKEIFLHIDSLQTRADFGPVEKEVELNPLRRKIAEKVTSHGIVCSLELTLYQRTLPELSEIVHFVMDEPLLYRLLITCCNDFGRVVRTFDGGDVLGLRYPPLHQEESGGVDEFLDAQSVTNQEVEEVLAEAGMTPFAYVASSRSEKEKRWLFYYSFVIRSSRGWSKKLHFSPRFGNIVRLAYRNARKKGRPYAFASIYGEFKSVLMCLLYGIGSGHPGVLIGALTFLVHRLRPGARIHHKSLTFQQGPTVASDGQIEHCRSCPDATLRDGKLVPVCMVDFFYPPAQQAEED